MKYTVIQEFKTPIYNRFYWGTPFVLPEKIMPSSRVTWADTGSPEPYIDGYHIPIGIKGNIKAESLDKAAKACRVDWPISINEKGFYDVGANEGAPICLVRVVKVDENRVTKHSIFHLARKFEIFTIEDWKAPYMEGFNAGDDRV